MKLEVQFLDPIITLFLTFEEMSDSFHLSFKTEKFLKYNNNQAHIPLSVKAILLYIPLASGKLHHTTAREKA